jgi:hypothetical protein
MKLNSTKKEIEIRNVNKIENYNILLKKFNSKLRLYKNKNEVKKCKRILQCIRRKNIDIDLKKNYHILRVSYYCLNFSIPKNSLDACKLALVHNMFENNADVKKLKKIIDAKTYRLAKILEVNRKKQWEKKYIKNYYNYLDQSHMNAKVVKCLDKFDNLFNLFKNPKKKIKKMYLNEINQFVLPMTKQHLPNIYNYYKRLVKYNINLIS